LTPAGPSFIVTADDFGFTPAHNQGIISALEEGLVSHASIMVNTADFEEAAALAASRGVASRVGLHLNLAEGVPLTDAMRRSGTFCAGGAYRDPTTRSRFAPLSAEGTRVLAGEVRAQIALARARGLPCDHLDSHRYVHTTPNVIGVVADVATEMGVRRIRPFQNCGPHMNGMRATSVAGKAILNWWLDRRGLRQVQYFGGIDDFLWLARRGGKPSIRSAEIMTHPRLDPGGGAIADGSFGPLRERLAELGRLLGVPLVASAPPVRYDR
jgi:predicted glycoside hydrolase/deacetylase ChbG (UPF0249 family)